MQFTQEWLEGGKGRKMMQFYCNFKKNFKRLYVGTIAFYIIYKTNLYFLNASVIFMFEIHTQNICLGSNENIPQIFFPCPEEFQKDLIIYLKMPTSQPRILIQSLTHTHSDHDNVKGTTAFRNYSNMRTTTQNNLSHLQKSHVIMQHQLALHFSKVRDSRPLRK